ncbi:adenylate/guanylate cyclase domain-containing protein [Rhizobium tubonense]|uniref:Adenylate/guanylate cyclase domain-containing protein n=1 Tax=Rhizobium tubonense TaxID=484088 RepID=A0A2W4E9A3_9HYPH|nr:adenylate/guanylate cyclase domain-containing protein [Rhizobium tubonense]PZM08813.1 adenylate/guanylate cyclase domain-containing protein [Rhizobium tubonense]
MDAVGKWLGQLGLDHLGEVFAQCQVDLDSLRLLSDKDLQEMQIPLGPRRKILAGIRRLNEEETSKMPSTSVERRQLTILFCDLVGSTEYAVRLDPEDFSKLTRTFLARCANAVRSHNGIAANYIGDAFQALFGYPIAEEDDAERAIELALDIIGVVPKIAVPEGPPLRVRIGIASGLVVVGDFLGAPAGVSTVALGSIPNLAQRLQALADPQTILTDQKTRESAAGTFEFTDLGARSLKGFPHEVQVWRVEKARVLENRFAKRTRLTDLVGRRSEMSQALDLWNKVVAVHRGEAVLISGEPGIGKSRLIFEIRRRIPQCTYLTLQCSSAYSNSALFPFLALLKRYAGISGNEPAQASLEKLAAILALSDVPLSDSVPIFAGLLSIDQSRYPPSELTSVRQRGVSHRILIDWLHSVSRTNPVLLSIEDEQWIDPSSSAVLATLIGEATSVPMLILITTREKQLRTPPETGTVHEIRLARLSDEEANILVSRIAKGKGLPDETSVSVLNKAEGVPLYVEELARAALETGLSLDRVEPASPELAVGVPSSLQSSLLSRLDKLGSGKIIAQIAAVIGREFDQELLAHLCGLSSAALNSSLRRLVAAGLIATQLVTGRQCYTFTHVLLQEAARDTLLRERYRELHENVAQAITLIHPKLAAEHPEVLAQHFAEAALFEQSADYWLEAGLNIGKTWAKVEAANMFANGLQCLARVPASPERDQRALRLELERGDVLYATFGYVTEEASAAYRNVLRLSEKLEDSDAPIRALDGLFGTAFNSARFADAEWASDQLLDIGRNRDNLKALVLGLQFKGMSLFAQGHLEQARDYLEQSLRYETRADEIGSDFPSMTMLYLSWTLQLIGSDQRALDLYRAAERNARQHSAYRLAACLGNGCILRALRNEITPLRDMIDELIPLAEENGFRMWLNMASFFHGLVMVRRDGDANGLEKMRKTCDNLGEQEIDKSCYLGLLADCYLETGDIASAAATIDQALELVGNTGENYFTAELLRLDAEVHLRANPAAEDIEEHFRKAIEFARHQGAGMWEQKTIDRLANLSRPKG